MIANAPDVRWDVISRLQSVREAAVPGSNRAETADLAISLALSPNRAVGSRQFLYRNVWRDARRILHRQATPIPFSQLASDSYVEPDGSVTSTEDSVPAGVATAEEAFLVGELEIEIEEYANTLTHGADVLNAILYGESIPHLSERLGISIDKLYYVRRRIRQFARSLKDEG